VVVVVDEGCVFKVVRMATKVWLSPCYKKNIVVKRTARGVQRIKKYRVGTFRASWRKRGSLLTWGLYVRWRRPCVGLSVICFLGERIFQKKSKKPQSQTRMSKPPRIDNKIELGFYSKKGGHFWGSKTRHTNLSQSRTPTCHKLAT